MILTGQRLEENIGNHPMNCLRECSKIARTIRGSLARCSMSRRVIVKSEFGAIIIIDFDMNMKSAMTMSIVYYLNYHWFNGHS